MPSIRDHINEAATLLNSRDPEDVQRREAAIINALYGLNDAFEPIAAERALPEDHQRQLREANQKLGASAAQGTVPPPTARSHDLPPTPTDEEQIQ